VPSIYARPALYEEAFSFRDVPAEVDAIQKWTGGWGPSGVPAGVSAGRSPKRANVTALELAAGPAGHGIELARRGADVTALDVSPAMVRHATRRAAEAGVPLDARVGDMSDFSLGRRFDLVLTMAGGIGHLSSADAMRAHFRCVARHLKPRGAYLIETSQPGDAATRDTWRLTRGGRRFDVRFSPRLLTVRVRHADGRTQRFSDALGLRSWTAPELAEAAGKTGLVVQQRRRRLAGESRLVLVFRRQSSSIDWSS